MFNVLGIKAIRSLSRDIVLMLVASLSFDAPKSKRWFLTLVHKLSNELWLLLRARCDNYNVPY